MGVRWRRQDNSLSNLEGERFVFDIDLGRMKMRVKLIYVVFIIILCGCSSVTKEEAQTVAAYETYALEYARGKKSTSTALARQVKAT